MQRLLIGLLSLCLASGALAQGKPRIEKAADLPRFTYAVKGDLEQLVRDEKAFAAFAAQVRRDTEGVLAKYDIADKSMQGDLLGILLPLDILEGKDALALQHIEALRAVQEKPADKLLAVNPRLKPAEVIALIASTSDKTADGRRTLVHPAKALAAARTRL